LFNAYDSSLRAGLIAIRLNDGDELVSVVPTDGTDDIFMVSRQGQALRFTEADVRPMGRSAAGVVGMRFRAGDELVSCDVFRPGAELLVVTSEGFGKRIDPALFSPKGRGGLGVRCVRVTEDRGRVVGALFVGAGDEVLLISSGGVVIRTAVAAISRQGRDATGVSVMQLGPGFKVAAVAKILTGNGEAVGGLSEQAGMVSEAPSDGPPPA
jgi:DNA gyrase subunit A